MIYLCNIECWNPFFPAFQWHFMNTPWYSRPLCSHQLSLSVWLLTHFSPNETSASSALGSALFIAHICPFYVSVRCLYWCSNVLFDSRLFAGLWILIIASFMRVSAHSSVSLLYVRPIQSDVLSSCTLVKQSIGRCFPDCILTLYTSFSSTMTRWSWCLPAPVLCSSAASSSMTHTFWCVSCHLRSTYWPPSTSTWT